MVRRTEDRRGTVRGRLAATLRRMADDESGSLTVEFVLWIPMLVLWLAFSVAVSNAYITRNQTAKAAHTLSDIVSRKNEMSASAFAQLYDLQGKLLSMAREGRALRVTSVRFVRVDPDSEEREYEIQWSFGSDNLQPLTDETFPFDELPVMAATDSVLYTEVRVPWTPFNVLSGMTSHTWAFGIASRPRFVPSIALAVIE